MTEIPQELAPLIESGRYTQPSIPLKRSSQRLLPDTAHAPWHSERGSVLEVNLLRCFPPKKIFFFLSKRFWPHFCPVHPGIDSILFMRLALWLLSILSWNRSGSLGHLKLYQCIPHNATIITNPAPIVWSLNSNHYDHNNHANCHLDLPIAPSSNLRSPVRFSFVNIVNLDQMRASSDPKEPSQNYRCGKREYSTLLQKQIIISIYSFHYAIM